MTTTERVESDLRGWRSALGFPPVVPEAMARELDALGVDPALFTREQPLPTMEGLESFNS